MTNTAAVGLGSPPSEENGVGAPFGQAKRQVVGVLALQGDFREHREALERLGVSAVEVRNPIHLHNIEALILPGGESTVISKLLTSSGLFDAIAEKLHTGSLAVLGTCAGAILSARTVLDGIEGQRYFGIFNATVRRNGIGPQAASFETDLAVEGIDKPVHGVFIRPPVIESVGEGVEVLASWQGQPIACRQGRHIFATFHPELSDDDCMHRLFLERL